jgi:hypothetical protein
VRNTDCARDLARKLLRQRVAVFTVDNESGAAQTISVNGGPVVDEANPFFLDLGINGRRCVTCHQPGENMTVSAAGLQARFRATRGTDPIFRTNDGSNSPLADVSTTDARRAAYSMLLRKGVIRVGLSIPTTAEFELVAVRDPYGYAGHNANNDELSLFRRPLPATNLGFLSTVMWDGRESSTQTGTIPITPTGSNPGDLQTDLLHQSVDATMGHAQATTPPTPQQQRQIVMFELGLSTAQTVVGGAGSLEANGASGGPVALYNQPFYVGINDPLGDNPQGKPFSPVIFTLFNQTWADSKPQTIQRRGSILRGQTPDRSFTKDGRVIDMRTGSVQDLIDSVLMFCGTPDQVYQQIVDFVDYTGGLGNLLIMAQGGHLNHADTADQLTLMAKEVMPRLKEYKQPVAEIAAA